MKKLNVTVFYQCAASSSIEVPDELSFEESIQYAREHLNTIPLPTNDYNKDSIVLDVDNCDFEANFRCNNCGHEWDGTRDTNSDDYTDVCSACGSVNIGEV